MTRISPLALRVVVMILILLSLTHTSLGYSVLTHEAIIDSAWDDSIEPILLKRFPRSTAEQLREAHAYAYGGAIIQDMGYYSNSVSRHVSLAEIFQIGGSYAKRSRGYNRLKRSRR